MDSEQKHTKGPWEVREVNNGRVRRALHIFAAGWPGTLICEDVYGRTLEEGDANRALVKAAPEMYEALKALVESLDWESKRSGTTYAGHEDARAAIAKVEGR